MPVQVDYTLGKDEDGTLGFSLTPPAPGLAGAAVQYQQSRRQGGPPFVTKYLNSGFSGVSGITILNSGTSQLNIALGAADMSGRDCGAYYYRIIKLTSPQTVLSEGYRLSPS